MQHKYRVKGDFSILMNWERYFGMGSLAPQSTPSPAAPKKTNMNLLLLPWIFLWVLLPLQPLGGGIYAVLLCAALPLAYWKYQATPFEYLGGFAVSCLGLSSFLGGSQLLILPLSYLLFGILWTSTAFFKVPLTAYYSNHEFGGRQAWENPLFMQTNRILTAAWGILYLLTPIWTYFLLLSPLASWTGVLNSLLPLLMGLFTMWFKDWYPAFFASRE